MKYAKTSLIQYTSVLLYNLHAVVRMVKWKKNEKM